VSKLILDEPIRREIRRISITIAILRYDIREGLVAGTPLSVMSDLFTAVGILQEQKLLLELGRFKELPYHIQVLYT
jgi:hypothetical protein